MRLIQHCCTALLALTCTAAVASADQSSMESKVHNAAREVMQQYSIPGLAIAVTVDGHRTFYSYGVASKQTQQKVTDETLFEIGSISKTFTATLAAYAEVEGKLSLTDHPGKYLPELAGSAFDRVNLINLGTHTAGGFPLQVPDEVQNNRQLMDYFKVWQPSYAAGTQRTYANPSIGALGMITAASLGVPFASALEQQLFPALGMRNSFVQVPASKMAQYAQGYNKQDAPVRLNPGVLADEAYGVGAMTQDLIWEQYDYPAPLQTLLDGNSSAMILGSHPVTALNPPRPPQQAVWVNKTGSTGGFSAYVAFVPEKKIGIVILANKSYPNEPRVQLAHLILSELAH
jgi:beta-lactamase class C